MLEAPSRSGRILAAPRALRGPIPSLAPDRYERFLAAASAVLLLAVLAAIARGYPGWGRVPAIIWAHLLTILVALALTPAMLLRPRGTRLHRRLGAVWLAAMLATALLSLGVQTSKPPHFSPIHILSLVTILSVPAIWWTARAHRVARHRLAVRVLVTGALVLAGTFTFPFYRLLGTWLFG